MDETYIRSSLLEWIVDFVEQPNSLLGDWPPCPYARKARLDNKFKILFDYSKDFADSIAYSKLLLETNDVVIVCFDHTQINADDVQQLVISNNKSLMQEDYVILEDHPDAAEFVNGLNMNFGKCGLLLIQQLSKLTTASDQLQTKGYYNHWDKKSYQEVVAWRQFPNSVK